MKTQDVIDLALASGLYQDGDMFFSPTTGDADVHIADLEYFAKLVEDRTLSKQKAGYYQEGYEAGQHDMSTKPQNVDTSAKRVYASDISATSDKSGISDKADEQAEKQDAESLFKFMANNKEVLLLDEQGFHYKGDVVHDAGIAYRLFVEWMKESKQAEKQEPVAYLCESAVGHKYFRWKKTTSHYKPIPLYTAPPKREWVGLTDDELEEYSKWFGGKNVVKAIEDKLKEKNDTINS